MGSHGCPSHFFCSHPYNMYYGLGLALVWASMCYGRVLLYKGMGSVMAVMEAGLYTVWDAESVGIYFRRG